MAQSIPDSRFKNAYEGVPAWDIGRAQSVYQALADRRMVASPLVDLGCGTGENALAFAAAGIEVLGVDIIQAAIDKATLKATSRTLNASFQVADALNLQALERRFRTIIDCALFHAFNDERRIQYEASLAAALEPGGFYYMLVFSDEEPGDWGGPRRISKAEITDTFSRGWKIHSIEAAKLETNIHEQGGRAWFSTIERTE